MIKLARRKAQGSLIVIFAVCSMRGMLLYRNAKVYGFLPSLTGLMPLWVEGLFCGVCLAALSGSFSVRRGACLSPALIALCALRLVYEFILKTALLSVTSSQVWLAELLRAYPIRPDGGLSSLMMGFLAGTIIINIAMGVLSNKPVRTMGGEAYVLGGGMLLMALAAVFCDGYNIEQPDRSLAASHSFRYVLCGYIMPILLGAFLGYAASHGWQQDMEIWPFAFAALITLWFITAPFMPDAWLLSPLMFVPRVIQSRAGATETVAAASVLLGACAAYGAVRIGGAHARSGAAITPPSH